VVDIVKVTFDIYCQGRRNKSVFPGSLYIVSERQGRINDRGLIASPKLVGRDEVEPADFIGNTCCHKFLQEFAKALQEGNGAVGAGVRHICPAGLRNNSNDCSLEGSRVEAKADTAIEKGDEGLGMSCEGPFDDPV